MGQWEFAKFLSSNTPMYQKHLSYLNDRYVVFPGPFTCLISEMWYICYLFGDIFIINLTQQCIIQHYKTFTLEKDI
jgi:hypothetical protein